MENDVHLKRALPVDAADPSDGKTGLIKTLARNLSRIGVDDRLLENEAKHVVFLNVVTLLVFVVAIPNVLLMATHLPATFASLIAFITHLVLIALTLFLNYQRRYLVARIFFSVVAALFLVLHTAMLGTESRFQFFLAISVFLMFYLFPAREKFWMYSMIALFGACFICAESLFPAGGLVGGIPMQVHAQLSTSNTVGVLFCALSMGGIGYATIKNAEAKFVREHERSEMLLRNILPASIAEQLKCGNGNIAESHSQVTILFVDIVGFTALSETMQPSALLRLLDDIFSELDDLTDKYQLEKIKTIGDSYMVVAGAPEQRPDHAEAIATMSLEIMHRFSKSKRLGQHALELRAGIHSGPVVAGVIGKKKFTYDIWGDSVNMAARLEAHGISGEIHVSAHVRDLLKDRFLLEERGLVDIRSKGQVITYLLKGHLCAPPERCLERNSGTVA